MHSSYGLIPFALPLKWVCFFENFEKCVGCWEVSNKFDEKSFYFGLKELQFGNEFWTIPIPQPKIASQVTSDVK